MVDEGIQCFFFGGIENVFCYVVDFYYVLSEFQGWIVVGIGGFEGELINVCQIEVFDWQVFVIWVVQSKVNGVMYIRWVDVGYEGFVVEVNQCVNQGFWVYKYFDLMRCYVKEFFCFNDFKGFVEY